MLESHAISVIIRGKAFSDCKMIEVRDFSFAYNDKNVLTHLSAHFPLGTFCAIVGPNGAGKSTLLKAIAKLLDKTSGIFIDGTPLNEYSFATLAKKVAYVPQRQDVVFDFSVSDTVMMGRNPYQGRWAAPSDADMEIVAEALAMTHLSELKERMLLQLSGGELQRTYIARAIAQQTPILLLDEPLSNLDVAHQLEIMEIVSDLNRNKNTTVLFVVHDFSMAMRYASSVLLMEAGRIVDFGEPGAVLTPEKIRSTFHIPDKYAIDNYGRILFN